MNEELRKGVAVVLHNGQVAVLRGQSETALRLVLHEEDGVDESYCPPKSMTVINPAELRDFLNKHLPLPNRIDIPTKHPVIGRRK